MTQRPLLWGQSIVSEAEILTLDPTAANRENSIEDRVFHHPDRTMPTGVLPPRTKLSEEEPADIYQVSRARIRAVLQRLAYERLGELKRNRGAYPSLESELDLTTKRDRIVNLYSALSAVR